MSKRSITGAGAASRPSPVGQNLVVALVTGKALIGLCRLSDFPKLKLKLKLKRSELMWFKKAKAKREKAAAKDAFQLAQMDYNVRTLDAIEVLKEYVELLHKRIEMIENHPALSVPPLVEPEHTAQDQRETEQAFAEYQEEPNMTGTPLDDINAILDRLTATTFFVETRIFKPALDDMGSDAGVILKDTLAFLTNRFVADSLKIEGPVDKSSFGEHHRGHVYFKSTATILNRDDLEALKRCVAEWQEDPQT